MAAGSGDRQHGDGIEHRCGPYRRVVVDRAGLWVEYERGRELVFA